MENPISIDQIETNIYLGNATAASSISTLKTYGITHILTIDSVPLLNNVSENPEFVTKYIRASDVPREDLLQRFEECLAFIEDAVNTPNKKVLVHCYYGVSRSATIVIAFIMKKYRLRYDKAFERVKAKRILTQPNTGFVQQLRLFHRMGFKIDKSDEKYKIYRLRLAADSIKKAKILGNTFSDLIKSDPALTQETPEPITFRCKNCRRVLAAKSHLLTHNISQEITEVERLMHGTSLNSDHSDKSNEHPKVVCSQAYFFEPIAWMHSCGIENNTQGKLFCPKCLRKLGSFNWVMSVKCPCGKQIQPAFYIMPSRVDKTNVVQNVQVTV